MDCEQTQWMTNSAFLEDFNRRTIRDRVPLSGSIDLTYRCNFRCIHCYLGDRKFSKTNLENELDTRQWLDLIDQMADAGCLFLLITGGDPLLRDDFCTIYSHARRRGLIVTVFTNGSTLSHEILTTFRDHPPRLVEITLYGMSEPTYAAITGKKHVFASVVDNIRILISHDIPVGLKTILMRSNVHELGAMKDFADSLGRKFRYDAAIFPRFYGDSKTTRQRLSPEQAVKIDFSDPLRYDEWVRYYKRIRSIPIDDHLYHCGSGMTTFHITPHGILKPCIMADSVQDDITKKSFAKGWNDVIPSIRMKKRTAPSPCDNCEKIALCGNCPPFAALECGSEEGISDFLCATGRIRYTLIHQAMDW